MKWGPSLHRVDDLQRHLVALGLHIGEVGIVGAAAAGDAEVVAQVDVQLGTGGEEGYLAFVASVVLAPPLQALAVLLLVAKDGQDLRMGALIKEMGFYNQRYCGCEFSLSAGKPPLQ